ncbi:tetratricopeptide repeat protein [Marinobacter daepoensis]|uniref:Tetratricopeptide repeat protein n=1 Tax=Marinobacter daepoensis TaxID=262077 RepID=A0ABS3BCN4_9GAMM|nr:tetratricopeptide repeat protein [Marinobacter daepoensis]MBY6078222.1 tetratricopeptide repeat protein [Marinobacter daepoensis]
MRRSLKRPSLFGMPALVVMGTLAIVLLYVLHPREAFFDQIGRLKEPDALSLAYLSVLLDADSDNEELRVRLAQMQSDVGDSREALETLQPLLRSPSVPPEAARLALSLATADLAAAPDTAIRQQRKAALLAMVKHLVTVPGADGEIHRMVEPLLNWLTPEEQLQLLPSLLGSANEEDRLWLMLSLGNAQVASGDPAAAAETLEQIIDDLPEPEQPRAGQELVRLYLASGQPLEALATFQARGLMTPGSDGVQDAVRLARLAGNDALERQWLLALTAVRSGDVEALRRLRGLQLANGDLSSAAKTAVRIIQLDDASIEDRVWAARVLEWEGQPEVSLAQWRSLYREHGHLEALQRSTALSRDLYLWDDLLRVLELARNRGDLDADGYLLLGDGYTRAVELEQAMEILEEGERRYPGQQGFVDRLYQLYVNNNRYLDAIRLFERKQTLKEPERLILANLYWRTRQVERAIATLEATFTTPEHFTEAELMRLDLLTLLGDPEKLREEYQTLMAGNWQQHDEGVADRLIGLAAQFGDYKRVAGLAEAQFEQTGDPGYLSILADAQANTSQWPALEETLQSWEQYSSHEQDDRYWAFRGRLSEHAGQRDRAEQAYRRALVLSPENEDILGAWGWLLVADAGGHEDRLRAVLTELSLLPGQRQHALLAYGYAELGEDQRARYWLQKLRQGGDAGWLPLAEQASLAERLGYPVLAFHLRRFAARQEPVSVQPRTPSLARRPDAVPEARSAPLYVSDNRAVQLGWQRERISSMAVDHYYGAWDYSTEAYRVTGRVASLDTNNDTRFTGPVRPSSEGQVMFQNNATDWLLTAGIGHLDRLEGSGLWSALELRFQPGRRWQVTLGQYLGERATDSAEAWWLIDKNRTSLEGTYQADSRTVVGARVEALSFDAAGQSEIAEGQRYELFGSYQLSRGHPDWVVRGEYVLQDLGQMTPLKSETQSLFTRPLGTDELLTRDYERLSVGMRWQEQAPHSLLEQRAQPGWYFDMTTGYVLSSETVEYGISGGVSWSVGGNDEIALSAGYSSDSLSGDSTVDARLTYTLFFNTSGDNR